jgi:hypothetical protein
VWRSPLGGGRLRLPGDLPLRGGRPAEGRSCPGGAQWTTPRPEVGGFQQFLPFPCWFGFRHFGFGGADTSPSRPSPLFVLFVSHFEKLIWKARGGGWPGLPGRDEGGERSEQGKAGPRGAERTGAVGRAPDGNGAERAWPPTAASLPSAVSAGLTGLAGLRVTSDADRRMREAGAGGGGQWRRRRASPSPGQRRDDLLCHSAARWRRFLSPAWPPGGRGKGRTLPGALVPRAAGEEACGGERTLSRPCSPHSEPRQVRTG